MTPTLLPGAAHFQVAEEPAYVASGSGEHLYLHIRKVGLTTDEVATAIAKACGVKPMDVGFAGRKDRHAVTTQWFSVYRGKDEAAAKIAEHFDASAFTLLAVTRHSNKLRLGHLAGNAFRLGLGGIADTDALAKALHRLTIDGIPNRFGAQRFGVNGANLNVAAAWAAGNHDEAIRWIIDPSGAWQTGQPLPDGFRQGFEGRILGTLRRGATSAKALERADDGYRKLVASAAQSAIFNAVFDARSAAGDLHRIHAGDVGMNAKGAPFVAVEADLADLNQRAAPGNLDIRATGPIPGTNRLIPTGERLVLELQWSAPTGFDWSWFKSGPLESPGERRPLVVPFLRAPVIEAAGDITWLSFALPSGCYATEVLSTVGVAIPEDRRG